MSAGNVNVTITLDTREFNAAIKRTTRAMTRLATTMRRAQRRERLAIHGRFGNAGKARRRMLSGAVARPFEADEPRRVAFVMPNERTRHEARR